MSNLRIVCMDNILEIGKSVDKFLMSKNKVKSSYLMNVKRDRFNNGEGKFTILESIRDKDVFILSDVGNYGVTYNMHGIDVPMGPDEHFQDIKRCISAMSGYAKRIVLVMPLLYQSRQDKRNGRESLDCAMALKELENLGVDHIVTIDAHDANVCNAIPNIPFENFFPANIVLEELIEKEDISNLLVISPDVGAMQRARFYADMLRVNVGLFYKRRDLTKIVNGKNPIIEHSYLGSSVNGKTCIVVDDMIASGSSMIEVGERLKELGAKKVFFITTFSLFTAGIDVFNEAYKNGIFEKLYTTNLSYIPDEYKKFDWLNVVDCSRRIGEIIDNIHKSKSLSKLSNDNERVIKLLKGKIK